MELLEVVLGILLKILRESVLDSLLKFLFNIATHVAHLYFCLLGYFATLLREFTTTLLRRLWNSKAYHFAVVVGGDAYLRIDDSLLDIADSLFVPRFDSYGASIRGAYISYLIEWHHHAV